MSGEKMIRQRIVLQHSPNSIYIHFTSPLICLSEPSITSKPKHISSSRQHLYAHPQPLQVVTMSRHEELPNRFKRSRSPSREIPPQFGRPAQYGKVVIVLSDSEEDGMSMSDRTSPEPPQDPARAGIGTAHPPPQGTAGAGAGANMDMTTPTREVGKAYPLPHRPAPGPHGKLQQKKQKKGKPHYACSYCHSNQHTNIHCPHKDANLSSRALKALKMANRLDVKEDREALQAALALSVQGLQIPTGKLGPEDFITQH